MKIMEYRIALEKKRHKDPGEIIELNLDSCVNISIVGLTEEFVNLKSLSLKEVGLTSFSGLQYLPNLENLDATLNNISNGLQILILLPSLQSLNLSHNKIADENELQPLSSLVNLEHLHVFGNPLTEKERYVSIVRKKLPALKYLDYIELNSNSDDQDSGSSQLQSNNNGEIVVEDKQSKLQKAELKHTDSPERLNSNRGQQGSVDTQGQSKSKKDKNATLKKAALIGGGVVAVVGAGVAAVVAAPVVIGAAGFGTAGVAAGSLAAAWQSSIGAVAAGSLFASLQSAGAVGAVAASTNVAIGATAGAAGGGLFAGISKLVNRKKNNDSSGNTNSDENDDDNKPQDDQNPGDEEKPGNGKKSSDCKKFVDEGKTTDGKKLANEEKDKKGKSPNNNEEIYKPD